MALWLGSHFYSLIVQAGVLSGFVQGLFWGILSFVAIVFHLAGSYEKHIVFAADSYPTLLQAYMYYSFIKNNGGKTSMYIQPGGFLGVMICYFVLSAAWLGISAYAYTVFRKQHSINKLVITMAVYSGIAIATIILDLLFCIFLAVDYNSILNMYIQTGDITRKLAYTYSTIGYGIVMVLAVRGFVLWVLNVVLTVFVIKVCVELIYNPPTTDSTSAKFSTFPSRPRLRNFPPEVRHDPIETDPSRKRYTTPSDIFSTTSSFLRVYDPLNYTFDPEVETRLNKYKIDPSPNLKHRAV